jgi:hypothetical protein
MTCNDYCRCSWKCISLDENCDNHDCGQHETDQLLGELASKKWQNNDELFFKELKQGYYWQHLPLTFFELHGLEVQMPELKFRASIKEAEKWKNSSDLIVNGFIIEVKSRNESFTSPESFPYETILVDTVSGYDAKDVKPLAYIMISRPTGAMLTLRSTSSKGWQKESKFDNIRKITDDFYLCKKKRLQTLDVLVSYIKNLPKD